ncbi:MAG: VWA domain-containing protein [Pseudomonadota bacterium]
MPFSPAPRRLLWRACAAVTTASLAAFTTAAASPSAHADIALDAALGQSVIHTSDGRVFLRVSLKGIRPAHTVARPPANIALVLDRSGSMRGSRLAAAKQAAIAALQRLAHDDLVSLVTYAHDVRVDQPAQRLSRLDSLEQRILALRAGGRTALHDGVVAGGRQVTRNASPRTINRVILLSDGLANVGPSRPDQLTALGARLARQGMSVTTIGLGLSYNEDLMAKLALASDGNHVFVERPADLARIFDQEFGDVLSVIAKDVIIKVRVKAGFKPLRVLGRDAQISANEVRVRLSQLYGTQEKYLIIELAPTPSPFEGTRNIADISVDYLNLQTQRRQRRSVQVGVRFSPSSAAAKRSIDPKVMSQVATQLAVQRNERALKLRDRGDVAAARKLLERNAAELRAKARAYGAPSLDRLSRTNAAQALQLDQRDWNRTRKAMRREQHRSKVQQRY